MWPVVAVSSVVLFYFLATGDTSWYTFVLLAFIVLERAAIQARIVVGKWVQNAMKQAIQQQMAAAMRQGQQGGPGMFMPPMPDADPDE